MASRSSFYTSSLFFALLALIGFIFLPSLPLEYGFHESTFTEILENMGWHSKNPSWLWFGSFLALSLISLKFKGTPQNKARFDLGIVTLTTLIMLTTATYFNIGLGYSTLFLIAALMLTATYAFKTLHFMQGDTFIIGSLVVISVLIGTFIIFPTLAIFVPMVMKNGSFAPWQFLEVISQKHIVTIIGNSFLTSATVGLTATILGLAFALFTTRIGIRFAFVGRIFSILPIVTPPFVVGLGVTLMLGRSGYVTQWLATLGLQKTNWLYGFTGIWLSQTLAFTPMAFMVLEGALKSIHPSVEEASYALRANQSQTFRKIIFPLLKPALANAFLIVAVQSLADFSNPLVLGGSFDVIATQIYFYIVGSQLNYVNASVLGMLLLLFSLGIFCIQYLWIGKRSYVTISGKSYHAEVQSLPKMLSIIITGILLIWIAFNLLLYGSIFYGSFTVNWGVDYSLTLQNYTTLFGQGWREGAWPSLISTVLFATIAAPITTFFGLLIAYVVVRKEFKGKKTLEFLTLLCFAVPGTVAGVSYIIAFNQAPIFLTSTVAIVVISMVMRNMPIGMRSAIAGLGQLDKSLDEASLSLRANSFKTFIFIVLPLLRPAILSSLVTSFVRAMTTVSAIIFLVTADTRVATSYILNRVEDGQYGIAIAYGSILIVVMMAIIFFFDWLVGDSRVARSKAKKR